MLTNLVCELSPSTPKTKSKSSEAQLKTLTLHTHGGQHAPLEGVCACVHGRLDGHVGVYVSCPRHDGVCVHVSEHVHGCAHAPQREHAWHHAAYQRHEK